MNTVDTMVQLLESDPDNLVGETMLVDALIEERDMTPGEARRYASRVRQSGRDARDLARAAELLAVGHPDREQVLAALLHGLGIDYTERVTVVLTSGADRPVVSAAAAAPDERYWPNWTLTVNALEVLAVYRRLPPRGGPARGPYRRRRHAR